MYIPRKNNFSKTSYAKAACINRTPFINRLPPHDIIFDPFMGVGTTGEAALKNNRRFIGTDINNAYVKASLRRLADY